MIHDHMAHFFVIKGGSKIRDHVAHFFIDIHIRKKRHGQWKAPLLRPMILFEDRLRRFFLLKIRIKMSERIANTEIVPRTKAKHRLALLSGKACSA